MTNKVVQYREQPFLVTVAVPFYCQTVKSSKSNLMNIEKLSLCNVSFS